MQIYQILKAEHVELKRHLKEAEDTTERAIKTREALLGRIALAVRAHAHAEELAFYEPLMADAALHDALLEGKEEHELAELELTRIEALPVTDETWGAKMEVLRETLTHHMDEEEEKMFPKARKTLDGDAAVEAGERFLAEKKAFLDRQ